MYTGIIQGITTVTRAEHTGGILHLTLSVPQALCENVSLGASISIDGVCLTLTKCEGNTMSFDAMGETLAKTTLGKIKEGDRVNIERSARMGDEIGGHVLSGHVLGMAKIIAVNKKEDNVSMTFQCERDWMKFILQKGFIALNGASLTVVDPDKEKGTFGVWFIPETLKRTTFGEKKAGDVVNVEIDNRTQVIVETVENFLREKRVENSDINRI